MGSSAVGGCPLIPTLLVLLASVTACGGKLAEANQVDQPPAGLWPPNGAQETDPALGDVLAVPGGVIRIGYWEFDPAVSSFRPEPCAGPFTGSQTGPPSTTARVSAFRLMRTEVSFGQYALCVHARNCPAPDTSFANDPGGSGPWNDPSRARKPAGVSYESARAFCLSYGGDLPTYSEWIRAAAGDGDAFGSADLTATYVKCALGGSDVRCGDILSVRGSPRNAFGVLPDVGTTTWDIGPYGHADLFASAAEWVRIYTKPRTVDCNEGLLDDDFYVPYQNIESDWQLPLMHVARDLGSAGTLSEPSSLVPIRHGDRTASKAGQSTFYTGFRCAFPPTGT